LTIEKPYAKGIRAELEVIDVHEAVCLLAVKKWWKRFSNGRTTLEDDPRSRGPPHGDLTESVRALLEERPLFRASGCVRSFR
jgi:hypothetical protein